MAFDPEDTQQPGDATQPKAPQGVSTDASDKGTLAKMWDSWTSHPENNAAMINFGLQMMQPIGPGQSRLGHFAQAVGAGAEASQRNVAAQEERAKEEQAADIRERTIGAREQEAQAYADLAKSRGAGANSAFNQQVRINAQRAAAFSDWLTGRGSKFVGEDNIWDAVKAQYPKLTTKSELLKPENAAAKRLAQQLHAQSYVPEADEAGAGTESPARPATVIQNGHTYTLGPDGQYH